MLKDSANTGPTCVKKKPLLALYPGMSAAGKRRQEQRYGRLSCSGLPGMPVLLLGLIFLAVSALATAGCEDMSVSSTAVGNSVLETGYDIDGEDRVIIIQTRFNANDDFYFTFDNGEPFANNFVTVELVSNLTNTVLADQVYEVDPEERFVFGQVWFDTPGKYTISVKVGSQVRATQEVIIE